MLLGMLAMEVVFAGVPEKPHLVLQQNLHNYTEELEYIVKVKAHDAIDKNLVDLCYEQLDCIPAVYLNKFNELGWSLYVVDWDINNTVLEGRYGSVAGVTVTATHDIYLEDREFAITDATIHEFGHFVDYMYDDLISQSSCEEFQSIYKEEKDNSNFGAYACSLSTEWFAELFWQVYTNPVETAIKCPRGYEFIKSLENKLCEEF